MKTYLCAVIFLLAFGAHVHATSVQVDKGQVLRKKCGLGHSKVKYVRAGLCQSGNGSRHHPYNSLAVAEADTTWTTLIVLSSPFLLDGGITLRPGTRLIGEKSPVNGSLAHDQPTITNSSDASNGGNGVIVKSGNVTIKNIYFKDTWASAIQYNNADDLNVSHVLATGWNQGELSAPIIPFRNPAGDIRSSLELTALFGQTAHNGTTSLNHVVLSNGHTGGGVFDSPILGAKRKFHADNVDVSEIGSIITPAPGLSRSANAILTFAYADTFQKILIENSSFHDFQPTALSNLIARGLSLRATNGGKVNAVVQNCFFKNIYPTGGTFGDHILGVVLTELPTRRCEFDATIKDCFFEETSSENQADTMNWQTYNSISNVVYKRNTSVNVLDTLATFDDGDSITNYTVTDNNATGLDAFYFVISGTFLGNPSHMNTHVTVNNNKYVGGLFTGGLSVVSGFDGEPAPWTNLVVDMHGNCFDGQGNGFAGISAFNFAGDQEGAGHSVVNAHDNNLTGFSHSVFQDATNVVINAQRNWWGPNGPVDVVNNPPGSVDVTNPLAAPIRCPQFAFCIPITEAEDATPTKNLSENVKERIKNYRLSDM